MYGLYLNNARKPCKRGSWNDCQSYLGQLRDEQVVRITAWTITPILVEPSIMPKVWAAVGVLLIVFVTFMFCMVVKGCA